MPLSETASGAFKSIAENFKNCPGCLAAILLALLVTGFVYMTMREDRARSIEREQSARETIKALIAACGVPKEGLPKTGLPNLD